MQIVNVQLCRSHRQSLVALPPFGNRLVVAGMLLEIVLITLIGYTAVGNRLFGTASISWRAWAIVLPFAIGMLAAEEARKAIVTWRSRAGQEDETRTPALPVAGGMQGQSH